MVPTCAYPIPLPFFKWRPTSDVVAVYPDDLPIPWSPSWTKWWLPTKTPPGSYTSPPNLKSLNPSKSSFWWCGRPSHKPFPIGVYSWLYRLYRLYPLPTYIFPGWFIIVAMLHGWFLIPDKSTNTHKHTLVWLWVLRLNPNWGGSKLHTHTPILLGFPIPDPSMFTSPVPSSSPWQMRWPEPGQVLVRWTCWCRRRQPERNPGSAANYIGFMYHDHWGKNRNIRSFGEKKRIRCVYIYIQYIY